MKNIAIIPARSGSKGLKDKNIKELSGKPLLAYSIEAALKSGLFDCIHVSTDNEKYAKIAQDYGADIPFLRSLDTASDHASSWDVVKEVLRNYRQLNKEFDIITLLQPTSPLRNEEHIRQAFELYVQKKAKAVVSVCETEHSPLWSNVLPDDLSMANFIRKEYNVPRQMLPKYYRENGAIYMVDVKTLYSHDSIYSFDCYAYIMRRCNSIDIDTELDFRFAELLIQCS